MMSQSDAIAYLLRTEPVATRVPCSRYGTDSVECAAVAYRAYLAYLDAAECEGSHADLLDPLMGLVVNDHDDIAHLLGENEGEES